MLAAAILPACAGELKQGERDYALSQLHASRKMVLDEIHGLREAQWKFKPTPESWSIAEIAEHLILTEEMLRGYVKKTLETPAVPGRTVEPGSDAKMYAMWLDRSQKAKAPEALKPTGQWTSPEAASAEFAKRRDQTLDYTRTTHDDLRAHVTKGPGGTEIDAYGLLLGIAAHTERHMAQLREVKADPKYPKR